jgi:hypothetical protein
MTAVAENRSLERLAGILAKAENTDNEAERDAYMEMAQKLSTLYSIGLATARAHAANRNQAAKPTNRRIPIGERGKRGLANYVQLMIEISRANNVEITIAHNSTFVYLWGFEEDIELTERLYGSLLQQMVAASEAWLKTGEYKTEEMRRLVTKRDMWGSTYKDWDWAPVPKTTARTNFQKAFAGRIGARLREAEREARMEAIHEDAAPRPGEPDNRDPEQPGTALVLAEKKKTVQDYFKQNSNARGTWKGSRNNGSGTVSSARNAGRSAADSARLSSPTAIGGARGALGA